MKKLYNGLSGQYNIDKMRPRLFSTELEKSSLDGLGCKTLHVILEWYNLGFSEHEIYRANDCYHWTDVDEPLFSLGFESIDEMMEKFKLPKSLRVELEKL